MDKTVLLEKLAKEVRYKKNDESVLRKNPQIQAAIDSNNHELIKQQYSQACLADSMARVK